MFSQTIRIVLFSHIKKKKKKSAYNVLIKKQNQRKKNEREMLYNASAQERRQSLSRWKKVCISLFREKKKKAYPLTALILQPFQLERTTLHVCI